MKDIMPYVIGVAIGTICIALGISDFRFYKKECKLWNHGRCSCGGHWYLASRIPNWAGRIYVCSDCGRRITIETHADDDYIGK